MSTTHSLTETGEAVGLLLQELQSGTPGAQQLRDALKIPKTYDDAAIWAAAAQKPAVIAAFDRLNENLPTSAYNARARHRFSINPDSIASGFTSTILTAPTAVDDGRKSASAVLQWNDLGDTASGPSEMVFLNATRHKFTVVATGLYSIASSLCLSFYPLTHLDASFEDQTITVTNSTMKGVGLRLVLEVRQGNTLEYALTLVDGMLSRQDFLNHRRRFLGGSKDIMLTAGSTVRLILQRDSRLGRYSKLISGNPTPVVTNEGIGFSKFVPVGASNQLRDAQNWVEFTRLA